MSWPTKPDIDVFPTEINVLCSMFIFIERTNYGAVSLARTFDRKSPFYKYQISTFIICRQFFSFHFSPGFTAAFNYIRDSFVLEAIYICLPDNTTNNKVKSTY